MSVTYVDGRTLTNGQRVDRARDLEGFLARRAGSLGTLGIGVIVQEDPLKVQFADGTRERIELLVPGDYQRWDVVLVAQVGRFQVLVARVEPLLAMERWD